MITAQEVRAAGPAHQVFPLIADRLKTMTTEQLFILSFELGKIRWALMTFDAHRSGHTLHGALEDVNKMLSKARWINDRQGNKVATLLFGRAILYGTKTSLNYSDPTQFDSDIREAFKL